MRAVVVALVGVVLAAGLAGANEVPACPIDEPIVAQSRARWSSDLKRPDLIGRTFTVEKIASRWDVKGRKGAVSLQLKVGNERFLLARIIDMPTEATLSFPYTVADAALTNWGKRDATIEKNELLVGGLIPDEGPLTGLELISKSCFNSEDFIRRPPPVFAPARPPSGTASAFGATLTLLKTLTLSIGLP